MLRRLHRAFYAAVRRLRYRKLPAIDSPIVHDDGDGTHLRVAIYETHDLSDRLGRTPERVVANYIAQALRDAGYRFTVTFGHAPSDHGDASDLATLQAFASHATGADKHLLLGDRNGGGLGYVGGRYALGPAGNIDRAVSVVSTAPSDDRLYTNARACIHELGHTLGGRHSDGMLDPPSMLWANQDAGWMDSPAPNANG